MRIKGGGQEKEKERGSLKKEWETEMGGGQRIGRKERQRETDRGKESEFMSFSVC